MIETPNRSYMMFPADDELDDRYERYLAETNDVNDRESLTASFQRLRDERDERKRLDLACEPWRGQDGITA